MESNSDHSDIELVVRTDADQIDLESLSDEKESSDEEDLDLESVTQDTTPIPATGKDRAQFVDWMRCLAIILVVLVHLLIATKRVRPVDDERWAFIFESTIRFALSFGMPMFFYFSGRACAFTKDTPLQFLYHKFVRLLVPVVPAFFLFVIPTAYIGRAYRPCISTEMRATDNFFKFYGLFFGKSFLCSGIEWLWFLPVLFGISIANIPLIWWLQKRPNSEVGW